MNKFIYIGLCSLALLTTSCEKWLTIQPEDEIEKSKLYETEDGFWQALNGVYYSLDQVYKPGIGGGEWYYAMDCWEDLIGLWTVSSTSTSAKWNDHLYKNGSVQTEMQYIFLNLYNVIAQCNTILQYIDNDDVNFLPQRAYNLIKGEALAVRAFCHFDLIRLWGPMPTNVDPDYTYLPYVKTVSKSSNTYSTYANYMEQLVADMNEAEQLLKAYDPLMTYSCEQMNTTALLDDYDRIEYNYRQNHMNYYGVCGLHARVALWMNEPETAVAYADSVIMAQNADGTPKFRLGTESDISDNTETNTNTLHSEILFSYYKEYYNWQQDLGSVKDNKLYIEYSKMTSLFEESDFRFKSLIKQDQDANRYCYSLKFICYDDLWIPLVRLSEMYFIVMECGPLNRANELYQEFCTSRGCTFTTLDESNRQSIVLDEYYKEFISEWQIFFANKRMAIEDLRWLNDKMREEQYVLPVPDRESNL